MKTCSSCRFWVEVRPHREPEYYGEHYVPRDLRDAGELGVSEVFETRLCGSPKVREYERPERDGASTIDGSHYMSCLATGPDFGCIHHCPNQQDASDGSLEAIRLAMTKAKSEALTGRRHITWRKE